jgi:hypothetical protein
VTIGAAVVGARGLRPGLVSGRGGRRLPSGRASARGRRGAARTLHRRLGLAIALAGLALAAVAWPALAAEREGVQMPALDTAAGRRVELNGIGVRVRRVVLVPVKVYVAGLYLERPSTSAAEIIASEQVKQMRLVSLRDLSRKDVNAAIAEGFQRAAGTRWPALSARLDRFMALIPDVARGQQIRLTYLPGTGTLVSTGPGAASGHSIEGDDFAATLFAVWLGDQPADVDLRKALLGPAR